MSTATVVLGLSAKLYRNTGTYDTPTWQEITLVKDVKLTLSKGEADATTRAAGGWKQSVATLKEASLELELVWDPSDQSLTALRDAYLNNTPVDLAVMDGPMQPGTGKTSQGLRALWDVFSFDRNEPLEEVLTVSVTLKPTYGAAPTWHTVTG